MYEPQRLPHELEDGPPMAEQALAAAAQISSIPTLMTFKGGTLVFSQPGALPGAALEDVIDSVRVLDVEGALAEQKRIA